MAKVNLGKSPEKLAEEKWNRDVTNLIMEYMGKPNRPHTKSKLAEVTGINENKVWRRLNEKHACFGSWPGEDLRKVVQALRFTPADCAKLLGVRIHEG